MDQNRKKVSTADNNEIYGALCLISVSFAKSIVTVQFTASLWQVSKTQTKQFMDFGWQENEWVLVNALMCGNFGRKNYAL